MGLPQLPAGDDLAATVDEVEGVFSAEPLLSIFDVLSAAGFASCSFRGLSDDCLSVVLSADDSAVAVGLSARDLLTDTRGAPLESALEAVDRDGVRLDPASLSLSAVTFVERVESARLLFDLTAGVCVEPVLDQVLPLLSFVVSCDPAAVVDAA